MKSRRFKIYRSTDFLSLGEITLIRFSRLPAMPIGRIGPQMLGASTPSATAALFF
jgi:hypothetical protein